MGVLGLLACPKAYVGIQWNFTKVAITKGNILALIEEWPYLWSFVIQYHVCYSFKKIIIAEQANIE